MSCYLFKLKLTKEDDDVHKATWKDVIQYRQRKPIVMVVPFIVLILIEKIGYYS